MDSAQSLETLPADRRVVLIGFNPNAGAVTSKHAIMQTAQGLRDLGFVVLLETDVDRIASEAARYWQSGELRVVVAAGGDGTASLVANRLGADVPMAVFPLGTENLLAKHLGFSSQPQELVNAIAAGRCTRLDAGSANGQLFLVLASCGFDADVVHRLHQYRRGHINRFSYAWPIIRAISKYRYPTIRIRCDDGPEFSARWAFMFNIPQYALQLPIIPGAQGNDGKLDLCSFRGGNLWNGLMYIAGVVLRQHHKWKDTQIARFTKLTLQADEQVPYQLDGDPGGYLPLEINVLHRRLCLLVTEKWIKAQPQTVESSATRS